MQVANNGAEVLDRRSQNVFDVVFMDVPMPVMGGFYKTARIREQERQTGEHLPIIAMTAHALRGDGELCLNVGMDAHVSKPLRNQGLFQAIAAILILSGRKGARVGTPADSRSDDT